MKGLQPFDYYEAPSDKVFEDVKKKSIELWRTYDDTYGYASEKVERVQAIQNIKDNVYAIIGIFDTSNQAKLVQTLDEPARRFVGRWLIHEMTGL